MGEGDLGQDVSGAAELFVLSVAHLDELVGIAAGAGWRVAGARRLQPEAFAASGAAMVVVDARSAVQEGLAAVRALAPTVEQVGAALLAIIPCDDAGAVDAMYEAGATQFLLEPGKEEFVHALRFAERQVARLKDRALSGVGRRRGDPPPVAPIGDAVRRWAGGRLRAGRPVIAARVALASFDLVNSAYGRAAGDLILGEAGERLNRVAEELFGSETIVARATGPEFLLAGDAARASEEKVAARVRAALARPFGRALVGARLGVACSRPGDGAAQLLQRASEALEPDDDGSAAEELAVELHHAIGSGQIAISFQPQVEMATGRITGVEALARWSHPTLGLIGADALFAAGERAGLGQPLSEHVQRLALYGAAQWPAALSRLRLSLNVTAEDVGGPDFADSLLDRVAEAGFPARRLTVEVTESGLIGNLDHAAALLGRLREAGCRTAIDDFGTGYSSLSYLNALPLDYLKLDKSLVRGVEREGRERVVAQGVLALARSLGLATVAEGVEKAAQRDLLASEGCDLFQGFLCSEAVSAGALTGLITRPPSPGPC